MLDGKFFFVTNGTKFDWTVSRTQNAWWQVGTVLISKSITTREKSSPSDCLSEVHTDEKARVSIAAFTFVGIVQTKTSSEGISKYRLQSRSILRKQREDKNLPKVFIWLATNSSHMTDGAYQGSLKTFGNCASMILKTLLLWMGFSIRKKLRRSGTVFQELAVAEFLISHFLLNLRLLVIWEQKRQIAGHNNVFVGQERRNTWENELVVAWNVWKRKEHPNNIVIFSPLGRQVTFSPSYFGSNGTCSWFSRF